MRRGIVMFSWTTRKGFGVSTCCPLLIPFPSLLYLTRFFLGRFPLYILLFTLVFLYHISFLFLSRLFLSLICHSLHHPSPYKNLPPLSQNKTVQLTLSSSKVHLHPRHPRPLPTPVNRGPALLPINRPILLPQLQDPVGLRLRQKGLHHHLALLPPFRHLLGRLLQILPLPSRRRRQPSHRQHDPLRNGQVQNARGKSLRHGGQFRRDDGERARGDVSAAYQRRERVQRGAGGVFCEQLRGRGGVE